MSWNLFAQEPLVTGKTITPVGANSDIGSLPMSIILSPNGQYAITTDMGFHQSLWSVDTTSGQPIDQIHYDNTSASPHNGLYYGLVFGSDGDLYAAQGENQAIVKVELAGDGSLTQVGSIATMPGDFPSGLAADTNGRLYVANNDPDTFAAPSSVAIYDLATGVQLGRYAFTGSFFGTPNFPLAIATLHDGSKTYVASQRDGAVYVLNTSNPANPTLLTTIQTGAHPTGLLLNQSQALLYVANAHSDSISVVSTNNDTVQRGAAK